MKIFRRRTMISRWPFWTAASLAVAAATVAWALLRKSRSEPTDDERREVEAFDEYERRLHSGSR